MEKEIDKGSDCICRSCKYGLHIVLQEKPIIKEQWSCHRYPPQALPHKKGDRIWGWPTIMDNPVCGEYEPMR